MTKTVKAALVATALVVAMSAGTAVLAISIHNKKDKEPESSSAMESEGIFSENLSDHVGEILISSDIGEDEETTVIGTLSPYLTTKDLAIYVSNRAVDKDLDAEGYNIYIYDGYNFSIEFAVLGEDSTDTKGYKVVHTESFRINTSK